MSRFAFVASWAHSLRVLPNHFPDLEPIVNSVTRQALSSACRDKSIALELRQCLNPGQVLTDLAETKKQQHKLTDKELNLQVQDMIEHSSTEDTACLRSLQGRGSGAWLDAVPTSRKLAISPGLFCLAAFIRLGLPLPLSHLIKNCECGKPLDQEGYHLITCKFGGVDQSGHIIRWSLNV